MRVLLAALAAGCAVLVAVGSLLPGASRWMPWHAPAATHLLAYGLLGAVGAMVLRATGRTPWAALLPVAGFGVLVEFAQRFVPAREASLEDALLNVIGAFLGVLLVVLALRTMRVRSGHVEMVDPASPGGMPEPALVHSPRTAEELARVSHYLARNRLLPALPVLEELGVIDASTARTLAPLAARQSASESWRIEWEERVFRTFTKAGLGVICLKGAALARWLYAQPDQRARVDLDLFVSPENAAAAEQLLAANGYRPQSETASVTQRAWVEAGSGRGVIDLHWILSDQPAFRNCFEFDQLWASARVLDVRYPAVRRLDRVDSLLHAIAHYYGSDPRHTQLDSWLLDILLLVRGMSGDEASRFEARCRAVGISGLAALGLRTASAVFSTRIDDALAERLQAHGRSEWRTQLATDARGRWQDLRLGLRGQSSMFGKIGFLREQLFPSAAYMRIKYPGARWWMLPWLYVRRVWEGWR